ncbi:flagellar filament capping protein FliD [Campylobacter vulpis]|uniref:Flagellar hook-associated protein 2 n=1 Tax=Campylobacter vulpis TaxID=1655500 RepID=A0ABS5P4S0_9BACT|nr:flagellar filament capping protein FliD [Campylobacter vulpis]MBS4241645.1 flagellar filament capping protein FliD [Campylobacter vulpis]MBS4275967.1 flagellar filament capping protein FliD [Campylobacter vulpis]MBS4306084.1 flagellar filament capping protein FliD [Campylobacter vulpis]MBS4329262.1 flagellar filament capping protein FliD [Campylobacter vulpis]MBS4422798.1 flagellar filament capping protein FliD [Campylobacter vulpis]
MALGTLSSLGFASGVLTQETIDKLKKAEEAGRIDPYKKKIEENAAKQKDLTEIKTKLLAFQTAVSSLGDATAFAARKVSSSIKDNPAASLSADAGVALQSMKVNVTQLAEKDVYQSKALATDSGVINANLNGEAKLTFFQNGKEYTVTIDKTTTYRDLADKITTASDGNIVAKIINTGEKPDGYRLSLSSKETGEENAISFYPGSKETTTQNGVSKTEYKENEEAKKIFTNLGWELNTSTSLKPEDVEKNKTGYGIKDQANHLKKAQNAEFTMDGIKMIRPSNTITDLAVGLTLTLNKTGEVNFEVQQDTEAITKAMEDLVNAYNDLVANLNASTDFNTETGTKGTLQGVSEVNSIRSTLISALFDSVPVEGVVKDKNGNDMKTTVMLSMQDFGLKISESGNLSFIKSDFEKKMKEDISFAEGFFAGITKYKDIDHAGQTVETKDKDKIKEEEFGLGDFKIVFNYETYDLSKTKDGKRFKPTGNSVQEKMQSLVDHINSLGIDGLSVKLEEVKQSGVDGFKIKFHSENGSDFAIEGKEDLLKQFGLSATKITAQPIEGKGIFAQLKSTLEGMTGKNGSITKYDDGLTKDTEALNKSKDSTQEMINKRFETMQMQFLQYEVILNRLNTQLNTISNMINAANQNNN